jgi:hypothetical protein
MAQKNNKPCRDESIHAFSARLWCGDIEKEAIIALQVEKYGFRDSRPMNCRDRQVRNDPPTPFGLCRAGNPQINDRAKYLDSRLRGNDKKKKPCHK